MGKKAKLEIKESITELRLLRSKQGTLKREKRIQCLLDIKLSTFETREALARSLGVHKRTMERWINKYKAGGVEAMLLDKPKNKKSKIITPAIHEGLAKRVNDPNNPFLGYWDAQNWVEEEFGVQVKYQRIREYLIQHFKTKIKSPRKSHYKKDKQAEKAFLKTS